MLQRSASPTHLPLLLFLLGIGLTSSAQVREVEEFDRGPGIYDVNDTNGGARVENGVLVYPIQWYTREGATRYGREWGVRYFDGSSVSDTPPPELDFPDPPLFSDTEDRLVREQDARATLFPDRNAGTSFIHLGFLYGVGASGEGDSRLERFDGSTVWEIARGDEFASVGRGIAYADGGSLYWTDGLGDGGRLIHTFEPLTIRRYEEIVGGASSGEPEYTVEEVAVEPQIDFGGVLGDTLYVFTHASFRYPPGLGPPAQTVSKTYAVPTLGWFTGPQDGRWALAENPGRDGQWDALTDVGRHARAGGTDMVNLGEDWYYATDGSSHYFGQYPYVYEQGRDAWSYVITREEGLYRYDYRDGRWLFLPADGSGSVGL